MKLFIRQKWEVGRNSPGISRDAQGEPDERHSELTRMMAFVTATGAEDWALVLYVCHRASVGESHAKEAVRALRREFKYGAPSAQLSAARLWAIMLRHSSHIFITQSTNRKFLDTIEELLRSSQTSPVVRERLLQVVAAAAYASGPEADPGLGFRGLWQRVKLSDQSDLGVPFDMDDPMFSPPPGIQPQDIYSPQFLSQTQHFAPQAVHAVFAPQPQRQSLMPMSIPVPVPAHIHAVDSRASTPDTISHTVQQDADIQRLLLECSIGRAHASLLSQVLALSKPEDFEKQTAVKELLIKCRASQEVIFAHIPQASADAVRSWMDVNSPRRAEVAALDMRDRDASAKDGDETPEGRLLMALLRANRELVEALKEYDDLSRFAMERKAKERIRRDARRALRQQQLEYTNLNVAPLEQSFERQQQHITPSPVPSAPASPFRSPLPLPPSVTMSTTAENRVPLSSGPVLHRSHAPNEGYLQPEATPTPEQPHQGHQQHLPQYPQDQQHQQHLFLSNSHARDSEPICLTPALRVESFDADHPVLNLLLSRHEMGMMQHDENISRRDTTLPYGQESDETPPPRYSFIFPG